MKKLLLKKEITMIKGIYTSWCKLHLPKETKIVYYALFVYVLQYIEADLKIHMYMNYDYFFHILSATKL